jgi:hypothetical protein
MRFNTWIKNDIQDFLPIIGNQMPSKRVQMFDANAVATGIVAHTGDGVMSIDYKYAYHSDSCLRLDMIDGDVATLTVTPTTPINMTAISQKTNEYAKIFRTGKSADMEKSLFFIINGMLKNAAVRSYINIRPTFYSGTAYAQADSTLYSFWNAQPSWAKMEHVFDNIYYEYFGGFTDDSWENITQIKFEIHCTANGETVDFYIQDAYVSLPYYRADTLNAYYPFIAYANLTNAIYVSQLFGSNANDGLTRAAPVETIEYALSLTSGSRYYVIILDSQVYKPIALDGTYVGIKQTLGQETTIMADYLETPSISAEPELLDDVRIGARATYRTVFYTGSGSTYIVKQDGTGTGGYTTIGAAYAVASDNDCIEIQDNEIYNEYLVISKEVTIQAGVGYVPTWQYTTSDEILKTNDSGIKILGIIFKGTYQTNTYGLEIYHNTVLKDCTFLNFGSTSGNTNIITDRDNVSGMRVENCLFVDNQEYVNHIVFPENECSGSKYIINCKALTRGSTVHNIFIKGGRAVSPKPLDVFIVGNQVLSESGSSPAYFIYFSDSVASSGTFIRAFLNDTNERILSNNSATAVIEPDIVLNYFHDNSFVSGDAFMHIIGDYIPSIKGNYFKNLYSGGYCVSHTDLIFRNNIFYNCGNIALETEGYLNTQHNYYNVFFNCNIAYKVHGGAFKYNIFSQNIYGLYAVFSSTLSDSIRCNSPNYGPVTDSGNIIEDNPLFRNPAMNDFSWSGLSNIESDTSIFAAGWAQQAFINPAGAKLNFMFMELTGYITLPTVATDSANIGLTYCTLDNAQCGLNESVYNCTQQGVLYTGNGIAQRLARQTMSGGSNIKNVIAQNNGVGVLVRSGADIANITCYENDYGIQGVDYGYFAQRDSLKGFLTILNSIFSQNTCYDYAVNQDPTNCLFYSSYYGQVSTSQNNILDPDYLFPAIKRLGYKVNSDAYLKSTITGENIGARNLNIMNAQIWGDLYEFLYTGTVDEEEIFYALENPQGIQYQTVPINNESIRMVDGSYQVNPTAYAREWIMKWLTPGTDSKIGDALKQSLELAFRTYWIIGFDYDGSGQFTYYKVNKDAPISFEAQSYVFSGIPYGSTELHIIEMPDFDITDYVTC